MKGRKYITLSEEDIEYIRDKTIISRYSNNKVLFEPIPEYLQDYFKDRMRKKTRKVDKSIKTVTYDWVENKVYITLVDPNYPGPYEFDCDKDWNTDDCINAVSLLVLPE
jgi:hypothetical protein